jgi:hypothetical protein
VDTAIYCADIGSIQNDRFGWARVEAEDFDIERHRGGQEITDLVEAVAEDLAARRAVALGFECPLFVPVPEDPLRLSMARPGEANRSWSAGAGAGSMATGIVQVAWILRQLRGHCPKTFAYLDWAQFRTAGSGLFLWEAFVTDPAKATTWMTAWWPWPRFVMPCPRCSPPTQSLPSTRSRWLVRL